MTSAAVSVRAEAYQGDAALGRLLAESGSALDAAAVRDLLAGVLAAPEGEDPDAWKVLVAAEPSAALRDQLRALKAALAQEQPKGETDHAVRLAALRAELARRGLDGFMVPHADEHQGEYLPARAERLTWLTGFTGSAGLAVVLAEQAAIFVDGRYTLQARQQVDEAAYSFHHLTDEPPHQWLAKTLAKGAVLGFDPWLHSESQREQLMTACGKAAAALIACADNPIDAVWRDQPPPPLAPVLALDQRFTGKPSAEKRDEVAGTLRERGAGAAVLTQPDSIAWLLNVRGGDVAHTPLPLSFALLRDDATLEWFVEPRKLTPGLSSHLGNAVTLRAPDELGSALEALGAGGKPVLADPATAAAWIFERLTAAGAQLVKGEDPCQLPKARKNPVELEGTRRAHRRDGAALTRFLAWLAAEAPRRTAKGEGVSELEAAAHLYGLRRAGEHFRDLSFDTISGSGPNGAIVHYRATEASNRRLGPGELYLLDSGAQYLDGTTDVTRTIAIGAPTDEMRRRFTLVLKGHIAMATARFPRGTTGSQLDVLARLPLWQAGLDYDHGTGHGVGSYLGVHEGPQRISKVPNRVPLEPGMIVSNEPGYYKTDAYGIRIENLVAVIELPKEQGAERDLLGFETLTLAPIDRTLVEPSLMTREETAWLDAYHARVRETLTPLLDAETAAWLAEATRPVGN
ncbi:MAG: aminopeptidase P family protein [Kiloniellales bacterium]